MGLGNQAHFSSGGICVNMRHFTAIEAVAREQSISKAAEKLFVTPQALSKSIREAEEECGRALFSRSRKGVFLTPEGERLYGIIRFLLAEYDETQERVHRFFDSPVVEEIRIGFGVGVQYSLGFDNCIALQEMLNKAFPEYSFSFVECPDLSLEDRLIQQSLDFGLSLRPYRNKQLMFSPFISIPVAAFLPADHRLADRESIRLGELWGDPFVVMTRDMQFYDYTLQTCLDAGFRPRIEMECSEAVTAMYYVANNSCVFLGMDSISDIYGVKRVPLEEKNFVWQEGIVYTKQSLTNPARAQLLRFMSDFFRERIEGIRSYESLSNVRW